MIVDTTHSAADAAENNMFVRRSIDLIEAKCEKFFRRIFIEKNVEKIEMNRIFVKNLPKKKTISMKICRIVQKFYFDFEHLPMTFVLNDGNVRFDHVRFSSENRNVIRIVWRI